MLPFSFFLPLPWRQTDRRTYVRTYIHTVANRSTGARATPQPANNSSILYYTCIDYFLPSHKTIAVQAVTIAQRTGIVSTHEHIDIYAHRHAYRHVSRSKLSWISQGKQAFFCVCTKPGSACKRKREIDRKTHPHLISSLSLSFFRSPSSRLLAFYFTSDWL